ncbi:MAG: bifunctional riboflavin kinase/FAD synthetase [Gammaproteobacteria bacterium]|nr:MAG: bifunctional riboflavin kinase/FAD synthetase [Gammaproteobacteria bacterium]
MRIIRGLHNLADQFDGCVATIGNFDGVHSGHRMVVDKLARKGDSLGLPIVVIIFEPQPMEFFSPDKAPARLTRFREKIRYLSGLSVDAVLVLEFNQRFAALQADDFIKKVLVEGLKIKHLIVGDDFRFGEQRQGNFSLLKKYGRASGFGVGSMDSFLINNERVSSTLIRNALSEGELRKASDYLGRDYSICGRVVQGKKIGRSIDFPTANIKVNRKKSPVQGVFAVRMTGLGERVIDGVANVGIKPTLEGERTILLEVHLFDFDEDIYGCHVEVHFVKKIRDEQKFDSLEALKEQIKKDSEVARLVTA